MVLVEQVPVLTMHDVLQDCESFKEDRAWCTIFFFVPLSPFLQHYSFYYVD